MYHPMMTTTQHFYAIDLRVDSLQSAKKILSGFFVLKVLKDRIYDRALYPVGQCAVKDKKTRITSPVFLFMDGIRDSPPPKL
jgi:hypothetical protein